METKMTLPMFYKELRQLRLEGWTRDEDMPSGVIRLRSPNRDSQFCPITAVAYKRTGKYHGVGPYVYAAEQIGLSEKNRRIIASSADSRHDKNYRESVHNNLLRALK